MEIDKEPITDYKTNTIITASQQLPVPHQNRICTDLFCTIVTTVFAITMFIIAVVVLDSNKLARMTYPTDMAGRHCTLDNSAFNFLYFTSPSDPSKRLCVSECPKGTQNKLACWPTDELSCHQNPSIDYEVMIYPSLESDTSMGLFCMPQNQKLKQQILTNSKLLQKYQFVSASRSIAFSALSAMGLGILFLLSAIFMPGCTAYTSIILGGIGCIFIGIFTIIVKSDLLHVYQILRILFCIVVILIGIVILLSLIFHQNDFRLCIQYLAYAGHSFSNAIGLVFMAILFLILTVGLIALITFQILAFWSHGDIQFQKQYVYEYAGGTFANVMITLSVLQLLWGLCFLKEAFDFIVSGSTVYMNFKRTHSLPFALGNLFKFHWGSVVGGSFILNFLYIFDIFYDFIKPSQSNQQCFQFFTSMCCCCDRLLGFSRSDALTFVNITGHPYCNSARYCQQIDQKSVYFEGSQSINKYFRIGSHVMLAFLATIVTYIIMKSSNNGQISVLALITSFIINLFVVTYFVSLIAEMAQSILLCTLVQKYIKNQGQTPSRFTQKQRSKQQQIQGYQVRHATQY